MYVRPPSTQPHNIKLPENYSGNAFQRQSIYTQMPPPARTQPMRQEPVPNEASRALDIPPNEIGQEYSAPTYNELEEKIEEKPTSVAPSIFSSLLPKANLSSHFPFGHGIGSEELLIIAVMLLVFLSGNESGEVDSEFILLLGLLLFAG